MTDEANAGDAPLSVAALRRIDRICREFENALKGGPPPQIEDFLGDARGAERSELLKELLLLDLDYRTQRGERPTPQEYEARFPRDCALMQEVFRQFSAGATRSFRRSTPAAADSGLSSSDSVVHGRFLPGTVLARRYRIVGLLGSGGMGEVYRADDLKLGQAVALKFLPERLADDPTRLEYFHNEVRLARQVSHPNVCRVYDIGEVNGQHFLSMEYVDGEDLATLIRRIGRLPPDKAVDIARQLSAGLAAAHDRGVLHRDLKPSNVMLDGRGRVRITDFGLARLAEHAEEPGVRAGTRAYMAPEQLAGGRLTAQSDLYSLGLLLFEVFTGQRAFQAGTMDEPARLGEDSSPATPSSIVPDIDPAMERVILGCLERNPQDRPASALAVAAGLPGGDPLAAALAAGETPSPEMVAAAGQSGSLRPGVAVACFAFLLLVLCEVALLGDWRSVLGDVHQEMKKPEVLEEQAQAIITSLGYDKPGRGHSAYGFEYNREYLWHLREFDSPTRWDPAAIYFWYRQSPELLYPFDLDPFGRFPFPVTLDDPPQSVYGMIGVRLDPQGRLLQLRAVPPQAGPPPGEPEGTDWPKLFELAGLDLAEFTPTDPQWLPPVYADHRAAWEGRHPDSDSPIRVEAASYGSQPVCFQVVWPRWTRPAAIGPARGGPRRTIAPTIWLILIVAAAVLARRNLRLGRADHKGGLRTASYFFSVAILVWVFGGAHVPDLGSELGLLFVALSYVAFHAVCYWLNYLALEPYVRRLWPEALISWGRLLAGRFRDPLVGRDLLIGVVAGACWPILISLVTLIAEWLGTPRELRTDAAPSTLLGGRHLAARLCDAQAFAVCYGLYWLLLLFLVRFLVRSRWLAGGLWVFILTAMVAQGSRSYVFAFQVGITLLVGVCVLTYCGLLACMAMLFSGELLRVCPVTADLDAWYWGGSLLALGTVAAVGAYGFYTSLAGRPLFGGAPARR